MKATTGQSELFVMPSCTRTAAKRKVYKSMFATPWNVLSLVNFMGVWDTMWGHSVLSFRNSFHEKISIILLADKLLNLHQKWHLKASKGKQNSVEKNLSMELGIVQQKTRIRFIIHKMENCPAFDSKNNSASQAASLRYVIGPAMAYWDNIGRVCLNGCLISSLE